MIISHVLVLDPFRYEQLSVLQASYAFKVMNRLSNHGEVPFSLCGDFNTRTTDPGYQLASEGYLNDSSIKT